jgi:hypothetical protein
MTETIIDIFNLNLEDLNKLLIDDKIIIDEKLIIDRYIRACVIKYSKLDETSKLIIYIEDSKDQNKYGKFFYKYLLSDHVNNITDVRDFVKIVYDRFKNCENNTFDNNLYIIDPITGTSITEEFYYYYDDGTCYTNFDPEIIKDFQIYSIPIDSEKIDRIGRYLNSFIVGTDHNITTEEKTNKIVNIIRKEYPKDNSYEVRMVAILDKIASSLLIKKGLSFY